MCLIEEVLSEDTAALRPLPQMTFVSSVSLDLSLGLGPSIPAKVTRLAGPGWARTRWYIWWWSLRAINCCV